MSHPDEQGDKQPLSILDFISSLISFSHSVNVFSGRWKLIRAKLQELHTNLAEACSCNSGDTFLFSDLVSSTADTVHTAGDLARKCVDMTYSGKLLMQSDLDILYTKLISHLQRISAIYTSGKLIGRCAMVVSKPNPGANIEGMRFYLDDLLTRIKIGDLHMKEEALASIHSAIAEEEGYVRLLTGGRESATLLVNMMCSSERGVREGAVAVVSLMLVKYEWCKGGLVSAGVVYPLIRVLEGGGSEKGKEEAARGLLSLTESSENVWCVSANGGVTVLLKICSSDSGCGLIALACGVLRNLVGVEEMKKFMVEEGGVAVMMGLIEMRRECVQVGMDLLQVMVCGDESLCKKVIFDGGIELLVGVLKQKSPSLKMVETAFKTIETLCFSSERSVNCLIRRGFLDRVLCFIREGENSVQQSAQKAAVRFSKVSGETRKALGDAGFVHEMVRLLGSKNEECRGMAAETICNMALVSRNRRRILEDYRNVDMILKVLGVEKEGSVNRKLLLAVAVTLSKCSVGRRKMSCSEYIKNVKILAEGGVEDAQRIIAALPASKFYRLLIRIWKF